MVESMLLVVRGKMNWMTCESNNELDGQPGFPSMGEGCVVASWQCVIFCCCQEIAWSFLKLKVIGVQNSACISTGELGN